MKILKPVSFITGLSLGYMAGKRLFQNYLKQSTGAIKDRKPIALYQDELQTSLAVHEQTIRTLQSKNETLVDQYKRLQEHLDSLQQETIDGERIALFHSLEPLLIQIISINAEMESGNQIPSRIISRIAMGVVQKLEELDIHPVGVPGEKVLFDPTLHNAGDTSPTPLSGGQAAQILLPGYRYQDQILLRAAVESIKEQDGQHPVD